MQKHSIYRAFRPLFLLFSFTFLASGSLLASEGSEEQPVSEVEIHEAEGAHDAHSDDAHGEKEAFNAGEMIMNHVMDAHDIHLMDIGGHAVSIPLPVILYSADDGLSVFPSSKFEHGHAEYNGYILKDGDIYRRDFSQSEDPAAQGYLAENWNA